MCWETKAAFSETMTTTAPTNDRGIDSRPSMKLEPKNSGMPTIRPKTTTGPPETGFQEPAAVEDLLQNMPEGSQEDLQAIEEVSTSRAFSSRFFVFDVGWPLYRPPATSGSYCSLTKSRSTHGIHVTEAGQLLLNPLA